MKRVALTFGLMALFFGLPQFPSIANGRVISPNRGDTLKAGSSQKITWTTGRYSYLRVDLELLKSGYPILTIAASEKNDGQFDWHIASDLPPGNDYSISIVFSKWRHWKDSGEGYFSIVAPQNTPTTEITPAEIPPTEQPPAEQPPTEQPPAEQPPAEQPPVEQPPTEQPTTEQPPAVQPPAEQPPAEQPPTEQPPTEQPPTEQPPAEQPPTVQPPAEQPPAEQPPTEQPPTEQPPIEQPPTEQPPTEQPPAEQPPAEQPPIEQPPTEQPPTEQPPTEQPPTEQPPTVQPPAEQPPTEQPPAEQPPAEQPPAEQPPVENFPIDSLPVGWAQFIQSNQPVFSGQYGVASDPSIIKDGNIYRMFYTGLDVYKYRTIICSATSPDGFNWQEVPTNSNFAGTVMQGVDNSFTENLETACICNIDGRYLLWYSGYEDEPTAPLFIKGFPAEMYLAASDDGVHFNMVSEKSVIAPDNNWFDHDAVYNPSVIPYDGGYLMIYCGHSYSGSDYSKMGVHLLAATSPDGYVWEKHNQRVLGPQADPYWIGDGAAEPCLIELEGIFYLFFTGLDDDSRVIGIARSSSPFGPWDINPDPIIVPRKGRFDDGGVLAPTVLIENNLLRLWYLGYCSTGSFFTGYAEASLPLYN